MSDKWTPEQFLDYLEGLTDDFAILQIRETLTERGLCIAPAPQVPEPPAQQRLENLSNELVGEAFCADWHDDPERGAREISRIKALFIDRLLHFACDEIKLHLARQPVAPPVHSAASTVEPVADFATEEQLRELFGEEDEPLADVINTHDGQWRSVGTCWRWHPYVESLSVPKVSIEPAAPTTSPEPDAVRDKIARIIDGRAFDNWQGQYDYAIKDNPAEFAQRCADAYYKEAKDTALEKADAVLAALSRPAHGGWEALAVECSECVIPRPEQMNIYRAHALLKRAAIALARNERGTSQPDTNGSTS